MSATVTKQTVPNLVQGVSQQAAMARRPTQCEAQFDCLNQYSVGCTPRPGFDWLGKLDTGDYTDSFWFDIMRTATERYVVAVRKDGVAKAWNYLTSTACTVQVIDSDAAAYLATIPAGASPWTNFAACAVDDVIFVVNKSVVPLMDGSSAPAARQPEALFFIKGGAYSCNYRVSLKAAGGSWVKWTYTTPGSNDPGYTEMESEVQPDIITGHLYTILTSTGDGSGNTLSTLGYHYETLGSLIHIWRTDGTDFDIQVSDDNNNAFLIGLKDIISGFDQLPQAGFDGITFKILGDKSTDADDYFVKFNSQAADKDSTTQGVWEETVAPATNTALDTGLMPVTLTNDAVNHFKLALGTWGTRVAGDGINSAVAPSFTINGVADMFFDQRRLALLSPVGVVWSETDNPFVFFPDTVQADLATAPIDYEVKAPKRIAVLHKALVTAGGTYLWGEGQQFYVGRVENTTFSDVTIEVDKSTDYDWNTDVAPQQFGTSTVFVTESGDWSRLTDATIQNTQSLGDTGITDHVPAYIPAGVRSVVGNWLLGKTIVFSDNTPNQLYVYEYRINQQDRLQSAWNTWRLPDGCHIVHTLMDKDMLYLLVQRSDGLHLLSTTLRAAYTDPDGGVFGSGGYLTRLDFRVTEAQCTLSYDATADLTTITLPMLLDDTMGWLGADASNPAVRLAIRQTDSTFVRGAPVALTSVSASGGLTVVTAAGDYTGAKFYAGLRIRAERTESRFYEHDTNDAYVDNEKVSVGQAVILHANSAAFRTEVVGANGRVLKQSYYGLQYGDPQSAYNNLKLAEGRHTVGVGFDSADFRLTLINDDYLPCSWQGITWYYIPVNRAP